MKKLFLLFFLSVSIMAFGQKTKHENVIFLGTDFSLVKVYGGDDTPDRFIEAFHGINRLFLSEPKKYNVQKMLGVSINATDLNPVEKQNNRIDRTELLINGYGGHTLTDQQMAEAVKALPLNSKEGTGLVIIAEVLNKSSEHGTFNMVFFDITSRKILEVRKGKGKAMGFGLRNHWAHAMLGAIKKAK